MSRHRGIAVVAIGVAVAWGCTLPPEDPPATCAVDQPPAAPVIATPFAGTAYLLPDELLISTVPFTDPDGDPEGGAEVELWTVTAGGNLAARVWAAAFPKMPDGVALADGRFEPGFTALEPETTYAVRVRNRDQRPPVNGADCATWGPWSAPRIFATDDGSRLFFDESKIQDIMIEIPPTSWAALDAQARPPGCVPFEREYYPGNVVLGGLRFDGVGVKTKGGCGSSRNLSGKASFKINLDWDDPAVPGCPTKRRYLGQRAITVNNGVQDRTASHERVGYAFYHAMGVASARAATVRVHVNGALWGVYTALETVDRQMLDRWFSSSRGMLYEGTYFCDLTAGNLPVGDVDNKCLTREFHPDACDSPNPGDDPQTYEPLRALVAKIDALPANSFLPEAYDFLDVDGFLAMWAADSVLGHWDNYTFGIINNYRIYRDPAAGLWHLLPSGIDQTQNSDVDPFNPSARLARKCIQDPDCLPLFGAKLREAAAVFEAMDLVDRAQAIHDQIMADVVADPRKEYSVATWESTHASWRNWLAGRPAAIRAKLAARGL